MNYEDFENWGNDVFEARVSLLREIGRYCQAAVEGNDVKGAAYLQGQAASWVKRHAKIFRLFGDDMCHPIPLGLYEAAAETYNPLHALAMATNIAYRKHEGNLDDDKGTWSVRDLREHFDIVKGKRSVPWLDCEAEVVKIIVGSLFPESKAIGILLKPIGFEPSGETPRRVKVRAVEVLDAGQD